MPDCTNPLWPCAMTGAVACLAGFDGISVVIHGSSGCYYYPATLLHAPLSGTFILEEEVIFGSGERLVEVISSLAGSGSRIAVVTTCVPAAIGEDVRAILSAHDIIFVDSPGFSGQFETGYRKALAVLAPATDPDAAGITIDGISLFDPFWTGNVRELSRLLALCGIPVGGVLCADRYARISHLPSQTISANGDLAAGIGRSLGGTLGFYELKKTFRKIGDRIDTSDTEPVHREISMAEERLVAACDKFLRRFDPPSTVIFSGFSYASFAAHTLTQYLDAEISCIGSRNELLFPLPWPVKMIGGLPEVAEIIRTEQPDLVIGSSFERSVRNDAAYVGITPPFRGSVRLCSRPLAGTEGTLRFMEEVLNACMDRRVRSG